MSKEIKEQLYGLNKASKRSVALYHRFALAAGISDSALGILYALIETEGTYSQYDLSNELSMPKQTINTAVNALEKKGFVSLAPVAGARNKKSIALTAAGEKFAEETVLRLREAELAALAELTEEERALYIRLNDKYNESLAAKLANSGRDEE